MTSGDNSQMPEQYPNTELKNNHNPTPHTQPERASASTASRLLEYGGPLLVVAVVLLVMATVYYFRWGFNNRVWGIHTHPSAAPVWLAFNDLGQTGPSSPIGEQAQSVALTGYDGQFYFYMAENPAVISACERGASHCPIDANPEREQRILYPMTARLLTLGTADLLHPMLFFIDFAAILITVFLVTRICLEAGASKWLSVAAGLFSGEVTGLLRDLAEPYAVMWTVLAVYLLRRNRPIWCAVAVAAALLTREQLVLVLPLLVVPLLAERRFRTAGLFLLIALGPFLAWAADAPCPLREVGSGRKLRRHPRGAAALHGTPGASYQFRLRDDGGLCRTAAHRLPGHRLRLGATPRPARAPHRSGAAGGADLRHPGHAELIFAVGRHLGIDAHCGAGRRAGSGGRAESRWSRSETAYRVRGAARSHCAGHVRRAARAVLAHDRDMNLLITVPQAALMHFLFPPHQRECNGKTACRLSA